jgi:hypothetical protein
MLNSNHGDNIMSKPSELELKIALQAAVQMKEQDDDSDFLAKTLLNHHYRIGYLVEVLKIADRFMNHGMAERERMELLHTIEKAKDLEYKLGSEEHENFGLE